jgi:maltose alpha-D-glucosyltransferase/alpha-amylase
MQWSSEAHGGFSRARKTLLPVIADGPYGREKINDKRARWSAHLLGPWF